MAQKKTKKTYSMPEKQRLLCRWTFELAAFLQREAQGTLCNGISKAFDEYEYKNNFSTDSRWPTETFTYWDLEKEGFRTFKASNLIKIKAATIVNCMHRS